MHQTRILLVLLAALVLPSCAPAPAGDFVSVDSTAIPEGKVALYLFRTASLFDGSSACNITIGDQTIGGLMPGQYTVVVAEPGKTRIETDGRFRAFVTVYLHAGKPTFIREEWRLRSFGIQPALDHLPEASALQLIRSCVFVESPPVVEPEAEPETESESGADR